MNRYLEVSDNKEYCFLLKKKSGHEVTTLLVTTALDELLVILKYTIESITDGDIVGDLSIDYDNFKRAMEHEYQEYEIRAWIDYDSDIDPLTEVFTLERVTPITIDTFGL